MKQGRFESFSLNPSKKEILCDEGTKVLGNVHVRLAIYYIIYSKVFKDLEPMRNVKFIRNFRLKSKS